MKFGGRIQASIEVLEDILGQHTPAAYALRDWGKAHRFAGSKDRAAIGAIVFDALRRKTSTLWRMDSETARALVLGTLVWQWGENADSLTRAFSEDTHAPAPLSARERQLLAGAIDPAGAPDWIRADVPEWLWPAFENNFGEQALAEGEALCARPPLDLRVNTLKTDRSRILKGLGPKAKACDLSPVGVRFAAGQKLERLPNIQSDPLYLTGQIEIQDEGSQIVSLLVDAKPGERVLDYCAGGGGKTLALAADMKGEGALYAFDIDKRRLAPLYARAARAGAENIEVVQPPARNLKTRVGSMDRVLVDAPCTGTGTWRRKPDVKWRLSLQTLETRLKEQRAVLRQAHVYVKPGGLLFYVTCSMLAEENEGQVYAFLDEHPDFVLLSAGEVWEERIGVDKPRPWSEDGCTVLLSPASTNTDGLFLAVMRRETAL
ncbi:MAG TPA: RsmB/NOP family class I SAM-dependent RNA methyltransferase [Hellea balneolensis]|uniref:RsmB/NOP family class I SAM-dependent RNA methyltransferase n=1 Tax=Hellea balneolensis TaxID=287478 RepID=A0A7V5NW18_9PROT|nr:RsmB/NOP family class I SAM-dependent RNA methyltransferase [Hellea balneolensis]